MSRKLNGMVLLFGLLGAVLLLNLVLPIGNLLFGSNWGNALRSLDQPEAMQAMIALGASTKKGGVPSKTLALIELRASQINGCSVCVDMHSRELKKAGETDERIFGVSAWRDNPSFTDEERAALERKRRKLGLKGRYNTSE